MALARWVWQILDAAYGSQQRQHAQDAADGGASDVHWFCRNAFGVVCVCDVYVAHVRVYRIDRDAARLLAVARLLGADAGQRLALGGQVTQTLCF